MRLRRDSTPKRATTGRGQTLVEFAIVFPLFWMVLVGLIEFAFAFSSVLTVSYASRNAALVAAEAGAATTADCAILWQIEKDVQAPSAAAQIQTVNISWTDVNGKDKAGFVTTYTRNSSVSINCVLPGVTFAAPYQKTADGYPMSSRCSILSGCAGHPTLDTVGVKVTYRYVYHTPYGAVLGGTGITLERASAMRMEPFQ